MVAERLHKDEGGTHKKRHCEPQCRVMMSGVSFIMETQVHDKL